MPGVTAAPDHYENFPVASWLCPPRLRPPIAALYHFARTADDIADEGDAPTAVRLDDLAAYRADLDAAATGAPISPRWAPVFGPLARTIADWRLPLPLLRALLDAFVQDVIFTRDRRTYADRAELVDYCRRSADPVGRLLLHLYGIADPAAQARSDAVCTALQLANFWQDLSVDIPRGRHYLTDADCAAHGVGRAELAALLSTPATIELIADCTAWTRATMQTGSDIVHDVPGRAGWELRLVVQGGLRILDRIAAGGHRSLEHRPTVGAADLPTMLWRALRM
ncbi:squalene synthase HpnC [uncultured Xylophilus sp.]|uniref:squalene synthase HpnC n=1 Tax=uncultured Xylophilus sp. TaxID=296832 RepID=UPI0025EA9C33|nr:squalene synthase HpnC [uncultured Xylophilus sp.]